jgi:Skp family chaperone for outer membrane proteins
MKIKTVVLSCLTGAIIVFLGYEYSCAQQNPAAPLSKIGVLSIRKVFQECQANAKFRAEFLTEQSKIIAEMEALGKEAEALEAGLKALVPGSPDHLALYQELLEKQSKLETKQQFHNQQRALKERYWTELLYKEILQITNELAMAKGLEIVIERTEPEFPIKSTEEFVTMLNTHKVLFGGGCVDITNEVLTRLNAKDLKLNN